MSGAKHSPGRLHRNIHPITRYPVLFAGRNTHVAKVITDGVAPEVAEANAERLLLCWNAHDELLRALEDAAVALELCAWEDGQMVNPAAEDAAKDVRAAIAKFHPISTPAN